MSEFVHISTLKPFLYSGLSVESKIPDMIKRNWVVTIKKKKKLL